MQTHALQQGDHLVGGRKHSRRNLNAKFFRGLEVDEQVEFGRLLERVFRVVGAVENFLQKTRDARNGSLGSRE
jgi:hypothetical protein